MRGGAGAWCWATCAISLGLRVWSRRCRCGGRHSVAHTGAAAPAATVAADAAAVPKSRAGRGAWARDVLRCARGAPARPNGQRGRERRSGAATTASGLVLGWVHDTGREPSARPLRQHPANCPGACASAAAAQAP
eukprot:354782-Chlamydomonas_euryale.AAC.3